MQITYNSPNRSHHYPYAESLQKAGVLSCFVSAYPRWGRNPNPEVLAGKIKRVDALQALYILSLRTRMPAVVSERLAWWSKRRLDAASYAAAVRSDIFIFYSGAGLRTMSRLKRGRSKTLCVVEAVNTHARFQEKTLKQEYQRLQLPFRSFPAYEMKARCDEYCLADAILCPSLAVKRSFVAEGIDADKIMVVPYGFPQPTATVENRPICGETFTVLYVGTLSVRKGVRYLVEAFKLLKHPRKRLLLVGPKAEMCGIENLLPDIEIHQTGVLKGTALQTAYTQSNVFVQPSLEEGLSLVLGEALSAALPVIATRESGVEELFKDGECGYHVPVRSPNAIAEKLQMLAESPALQQRLSAAALLRTRHLGGWGESGRKLVKTMEGFLAEAQVHHE